MKIGLINSLRYEEASQRVIPSIGLYYLKSYLEKYGPECSVSVYRTPGELMKDKPDVIGISSVTENMNVAVKWAEYFKEKLGVPIIIGGNHISVLPHTLHSVFDLGVIGEGEETFRELIDLIIKDTGWKEKLGGISGICFHREGKVAITPRRPLITPMDRIPYPVREKNIWGNFHYCFTSRGCPYKCAFCSPKVIWQKYRTFTSDYVMGELTEIFNSFKPSYIHFFDDLFIGDRKRVKEISRQIRRRGMHRLCIYGGHIRANMVDDQLCRDLVRMNFVSGAFGAESGSDRILKYLKAGSADVETNQKAIDICYRNGLQLNLSFIIGTPGETAEDLDKTIDFIGKNHKKMTGIEIFILLPYPGTPLWEDSKRRGLVGDHMNWDLFRTKAYFSDVDITHDFLLLNDSMDRETFKQYVKIFQQIDKDLNKQNFQIYDHIEKGVPEPVKMDNYNCPI